MRGESRKIQFTGKTSYIVSLPKQWVSETGVGQGDTVIISRHGPASLLITLPSAGSDAHAAESIVTVGSGESSETTVRKVISLYLEGARIISVRGGGAALGPVRRGAIKDSVRRSLMGAEIISDSSAGITIQILVSAMALSVDGAFKRMLHLSKSMLDDAVRAVAEENLDAARGVVNADDEVDRFGLYIIRQLKLAVTDPHVLGEVGFESARNCLDYRLVVKGIERTGDHAVAIASDLIEFKKGVGKAAAARLEELRKFAETALDDASLALFRHDYALAEKTIRAARGIDRLEKAVLEATRRHGDEEAYRARRIAANIRRIAEYAVDISETVLNMNIDKAMGRPAA